MISSDHFVQFFDADGQLIDAVSRFVQVGLRSGEVCVVITTAQHRELIAAALKGRGLNIAAFEAGYQYIAVDAESFLRGFFCNGRLDRVRFHDRAGMLLRQAASSGKPVRAFAEMVALLLLGGSVSATLELEELWNELGRSQDFVLFCGYPRNLFTDPQTAGTVGRTCALHTHSVMAGLN